MYTQLAEIPVPTSALFVNTADPHESSIVQVTYSVRDHARNVNRTMIKSIAISGSSRGSVITTSTMPLQDLDLDIVAQVISPSRKLRAVLRHVKSGNSSTGTRLVEIWNKDLLVVLANVTDCHGDFYTDEFLASLSFAPTESAILYTAEGKTPETEDPFEKFRFKPDFGEGLAGKKQPTTFIFRWNSSRHFRTSDKSKFSLVELKSKENVRFGQAVFSPKSDNVIYATGYEFTSDGRMLGLKFCANKPSGIWKLWLDQRSLPELDDIKLNPVPATVISTVILQKLTSASLSCRSPRTFERYHGGSSLAWLACPTGGAHLGASALYCLDISLDSEPESDNNSYLKTTETLLVPITNDIPSAPDIFPGLFPSYSLPPSPKIVTELESEPVPSIVLHSQWGSRTTVLLISTKNGSVVDLTPANKEEELYSWTVLATDGQSRVVCQRSSTSVPYEIYLGYFNETGFVSWHLIDKPDLPKHVEEALSTIRTSIVPIPNREPFETILIQPKSRTIPPLITFPHGGPHNAISTAFSPTTTALALEGYTVSLPNYTGSLGYGDGFVQRLIGNCGTLDVEDCYESIRHLIESGIAEEGPGKQFLTGGSHGGFLVAHLIGRYPDLFSAAVLRNPVISVGEISSSDIPDWYFAEFGIEYPLSSSSPDIDDTPTTSSASALPPLISSEIYDKLRSVSPILHVDSIKVPVLLLIGSADRRVANSQGINFYHALKARYASFGPRSGHVGGNRKQVGSNRKVEMLIFEGEGHPLDGVEAAKVSFEVTKKWLVGPG